MKSFLWGWCLRMELLDSSLLLFLSTFRNWNFANGLLRQLGVKEAVQPTPKYQNSVVVEAENISEGGVGTCLEAGLSDYCNFKRCDFLLHLDGHK